MVTMESVEPVLNTILLNIANHQHAQFVHHFPSYIISPQKNCAQVCLVMTHCPVMTEDQECGQKKKRMWTVAVGLKGIKVVTDPK